MFWLILFLILAVLLCRNEIVRLLLEPKLNWLGIQLSQTVYVVPFRVKIQSEQNSCFDLVIIERHSNKIVLKMLFSQKQVEIPLIFVEPGFTLRYELNGRVKDLPFEEGTPFKINQGELVLCKRVRRGLGFVTEEVKRSHEWPIYLP